MKHLVISFAVLASVHLPVVAQDAVESLPDAELETLSYWKGILEGGPIYVALHFLVGISFLWALVAIFRRASALRTVLSCLMPFMLGSTAMWIGALGIIAVRHAPHFEFLYHRIDTLPRPFYFGAALSLVALIVFGVSRALKRKA